MWGRKRWIFPSARAALWPQKYAKMRLRPGLRPDPAGGAHDAPPDLVGWEGGYLLPTPHPLGALRRIDPRDFGARYSAPLSSHLRCSPVVDPQCFFNKSNFHSFRYTYLIKQKPNMLRNATLFSLNITYLNNRWKHFLSSFDYQNKCQLVYHKQAATSWNARQLMHTLNIFRHYWKLIVCVS